MVWTHKSSLSPPLCACTKPRKWGVMYLCVRGFYFTSFCVLMDFGTVLTVWEVGRGACRTLEEVDIVWHLLHLSHINYDFNTLFIFYILQFDIVCEGKFFRAHFLMVHYITSHHKQLNTKQTTTYIVGNQCTGLRQAQ